MEGVKGAEKVYPVSYLLSNYKSVVVSLYSK